MFTFPSSEYKLKHMVDFVRNLPCNNVKPLSTGADILEEGVVKAIEEEVDRVNVSIVCVHSGHVDLSKIGIGLGKLRHRVRKVSVILS